MTLTQLADIANLVGGIGVIVSLLFLAWELHKNAEQTRLGNWNATLAAFREHKRRTDDIAVANVIARGRRDFYGLSEAEQIQFGFWIEEWLLAQEGLVHTRSASAESNEVLMHAMRGNYRVEFAHPGCRQWWRQSQLLGRFPKGHSDEIEAAIAYAERSGT
jgi:hypothetical protein